MFESRWAAAGALAAALQGYRARRDVVVIGLPRGGIPIACEVAQALGAPIDVMPVRKLRVPGHGDFALGAIASGGVRVLHPGVAYRLPPRVVRSVTVHHECELDRSERIYRRERPPLSLTDRTVLIIDDGLITGTTAEAASMAVRRQSPRTIIVAAPVATPGARAALHGVADEVISLATPESSMGLERCYRSFPTLLDEDVMDLLDRVRIQRAESSSPTHLASP